MNKQLPVISEQYASGAASLFAAMARADEPAPAESRVAVTCTWCLSGETEMVDHDQQIYRCRNCGELFERPSG